MHTSTNPRPRVKPARTVKLLLPPAEGQTGALLIREGGRLDTYFLNRVPADFGTGFEVEKIDPLNGNITYHVNLNGDASTCECKGFLRWGHCRHVESLTALQAAGQLSQ
jgi:hypothetical protein